LRFDQGLDENRNGVLDPEEIQETFSVCDGEDGSNGCSLTPAHSISGSSELIGLLTYLLIPAAVILRRRLRRK